MLGIFKDMSSVASTFSSWIFERNNKSTWIIQRIQSYRTPHLDKLFKLFALLGEEDFYIICGCLIVASRELDMSLSRHFLFVMSLSHYLGNVLKNILCLPRPMTSSGVWVSKALSDHGFPSTHSCSGTSLPWFLFMYLLGQISDPWLKMAIFAIAAAWCFGVCMSRLYLGVHHVSDVIGGMTLGILVLSTWYSIGCRMVEQLIHMEPLPLVASLSSIFMFASLRCTPVSQSHSNPTYAENGTFCGVMNGTIIGASAGKFLGVFPPPVPLGSNYFLHIFLRFLIVVTVVAVTKVISKKILLKIFYNWFHENNENNKNNNEKPKLHSLYMPIVNFSCYTCVAISVETLIPVLYNLLGF